jgi:RNA polymerase sigma-70 factor (ECF subfamily)
VSAGPDEVISTIATGITRQDGGVAFTTTHWSVVLQAQGESPAADEALERLCRTYWRPIYAFVRRQGIGLSDAEDLTQGFFAQLLERRDLSAVRRERGRLRSYMLTALKHFMSDERRRATAIKRGKGERPIPFEDLGAGEWTDMEPSDLLTAERIYERRWATTVLDRALELLKEEYATSLNAPLFDSLAQLLPNEPGAPSRAEIARQFNMTENAVAQAFHRFRQRYQVLIRQEIAHTVATPTDVDEELRHLIAVLRA